MSHRHYVMKKEKGSARRCERRYHWLRKQPWPRPGSREAPWCVEETESSREVRSELQRKQFLEM